VNLEPSTNVQQRNLTQAFRLCSVSLTNS
jgi:hypothetical protein